MTLLLTVHLKFDIACSNNKTVLQHTDKLRTCNFITGLQIEKYFNTVGNTNTKIKAPRHSWTQENHSCWYVEVNYTGFLNVIVVFGYISSIED